MEKVKSKGTNFKQGYYTPKNPDKLINTEKIINYRSSLELKVLQLLDMNDHIKKYGFRIYDISYAHNGKFSTHTPDFYFEIENGAGNIRKIISDISMKSSLLPPDDISVHMSLKQMKTNAEQWKIYDKNISKFKACNEYAKIVGFDYIVMNEDMINSSLIDEYIEEKHFFKAWSSQKVDSKNGVYKHIMQDKTLYL